MCFPKKCLTEDQTKYVYDKFESGDELKIRKVSPDIQSKPLKPKHLKERKDINLYKKGMVTLEETIVEIEVERIGDLGDT